MQEMWCSDYETIFKNEPAYFGVRLYQTLHVLPKVHKLFSATWPSCCRLETCSSSSSAGCVMLANAWMTRRLVGLFGLEVGKVFRPSNPSSWTSRSSGEHSIFAYSMTISLTWHRITICHSWVVFVVSLSPSLSLWSCQLFGIQIIAWILKK